MKLLRYFAIALAITAPVLSASAETMKIWLDELDLTHADQSAGEARARMSMWRTPIVIAADTFSRGVGTHANGLFRVATHGDASHFHAVVGVDASAPAKELEQATVEFFIDGDGHNLWRSGVMTATDRGRAADIDIRGVSELTLRVDHCGDGIVGDRADWADACLLYEGKTPEAFSRYFGEDRRVRLTPLAGSAPRINPPYIYGLRPGSPMLFRVAVSGDRNNLTISAKGLPKGLEIDKTTGTITGHTDATGDFPVEITARNSHGSDTHTLTLRVGEKIVLTPPMGWNSWNVYGASVSDSIIRRTIDVADSLRLQNYGYQYINIDDGWQGARGGTHNAILPNGKFPDMKSLVDYAHSKGFKIGIYSSPWVGTFAGYIGGSADTPDGKVVNSSRRKGEYSFAANDVAQWAEWGLDFLKYDWVTNDVGSTSEMATLLRDCGRDIGFSISNAAPFALADRWAELTNCWRTTGDIKDTWCSFTTIGFLQNKWQPYSGPGHYNDPDMLVVGKVGWGDGVRDSRLSPNEQYSHVSLWALLAAPLLVGCDLTQADDFTIGLITNPEVIEVDQDPRGLQGRRITSDPTSEVWARELADGGIALGLFNLGDKPRELSASWTDLGIGGARKVRDLWRRADLPEAIGNFSAIVEPHGVVFVKLLPATAQTI